MHIFIFTYKSPFSDIPEFVEEEIKYCPSTIKITLVSLADFKERGINEVNYNPNINAYAVSPNSFLTVLKILLLSLNKRFISELIKIIFHFPLHHIKSHLYSLIACEYVRHRYYLGFKKVHKYFDLRGDRVVLYSYWLGPATFAAHDVKKKYKNKFQSIIVSRAHGSDLYEYSNDTGWLPYLRLNLKQCDYIFPISMHGQNYILKNLYIPPQKVILSRLGIPNHNSANRISEKADMFHIVSCSYIFPIKRIHLIVEALSLIADSKIKWTHLGGGPLEEELKSICAKKLGDKPNVDYSITGNLPHENVIQFYKENNINLLINTSSSEGLPVSMMEATCFGVPILSSDIGGINEIVIDKYNGILLSSAFTTIDLKNSIEALINLDSVEYTKLCKNSIELYNSLFRAKINYQNHMKLVLDLASNSIN